MNMELTSEVTQQAYEKLKEGYEIYSNTKNFEYLREKPLFYVFSNKKELREIKKILHFSGIYNSEDIMNINDDTDGKNGKVIMIYKSLYKTINSNNNNIVKKQYYITYTIVSKDYYDNYVRTYSSKCYRNINHPSYKTRFKNRLKLYTKKKFQKKTENRSIKL